jgi:RNA polymerase sigma-70 factor (ECF subfamily)
METEVDVALADDVAFRRWYERTLPRVYSYLVSRVGDLELAEELTQQTFIAAVEQRRHFDGRSDSVTWLCAIARHKLADHFRRMERDDRRRARIVVRELHLDSGSAWRGVEERSAIRAALEKLPATQRAALIFVALDGLSVPETGRLIGKSAGATQSLLNRARESFRRAYGEEAGDD